MLFLALFLASLALLHIEPHCIACIHGHIAFKPSIWPLLLYNLHCMHYFLDLFSRGCRLSFIASTLFPFACYILALYGFLLLLLFPFACRFALHGFLRRFDLSPALHLGQWCLLFGVLMNQGTPDSEHWQCCWVHRLRVYFPSYILASWACN